MSVRSQRFTDDNKLQPCAFYLHRLPPTEQNYDVGDREVLAAAMAEGLRGPLSH